MTELGKEFTTENVVISENAKKEIHTFQGFSDESKAEILKTYSLYHLIQEAYRKSAEYEEACVMSLNIMSKFKHIGEN